MPTSLSQPPTVQPPHELFNNVEVAQKTSTVSSYAAHTTAERRLCRLLSCYPIRKQIVQGLSAYDVAKLLHVLGDKLSVLGDKLSDFGEEERAAYLNPLRDIFANDEMLDLKDKVGKGFEITLIGRDLRWWVERLQDVQGYGETSDYDRVLKVWFVTREEFALYPDLMETTSAHEVTLEICSFHEDLAKHHSSGGCCSTTNSFDQNYFGPFEDGDQDPFDGTIPEDPDLLDVTMAPGTYIPFLNLCPSSFHGDGGLMNISFDKDMVCPREWLSRLDPHGVRRARKSLEVKHELTDMGDPSSLVYLTAKDPRFGSTIVFCDSLCPKEIRVPFHAANYTGAVWSGKLPMTDVEEGYEHYSNDLAVVRVIRQVDRQSSDESGEKVLSQRILNLLRRRGFCS